jgi:hypothetical protein
VNDIGFRLDNDDDDDDSSDESEETVGEGHVSFVADTAVELAERLHIVLDAVRKMRRMGATTIEVGDVKATFPERKRRERQA